MRGLGWEPRTPSCQQSRIGRVAALNTEHLLTDSTGLGAASDTGATENPPMHVAGLAWLTIFTGIARSCCQVHRTARAIEAQKVGTADTGTSWGWVRVPHRPTS
jgi:hypothetical protein